ncbi:MAG: hypothetical protein WDO13_09090 [Verrucomicrobiota bacterium]
MGIGALIGVLLDGGGAAATGASLLSAATGAATGGSTGARIGSAGAVSAGARFTGIGRGGGALIGGTVTTGGTVTIGDRGLTPATCGGSG